MCDGDIPMTREEVGRRFHTLALEVRALKETVEEQGLLIANLDKSTSWDSGDAGSGSGATLAAASRAAGSSCIGGAMTVLAEVKVVSAADECWCKFAGYPMAHERLLGIEGMKMTFAATLIADLISNIDPGTGNEGSMFTDPADFGRFVAMRNWADPVGMEDLARSVNIAMEQAWCWRAHGRSEGRDVPC
jgi:hypothetical protein